MLLVLLALALSVEIRGTAGSAGAEGLMVIRREALGMLLVLASAGCKVDTGAFVGCVWLGLLVSFIIVVIKLGPTLFLGGRGTALVAAVAAVAAGSVD